MSFIRSYELRVIAGVPVRLRKSLTRFSGNRTKSSPEKSQENRLSPSRADMKGERRVSCRDLGHGDCEGWLWKKKSGEDTSGGGPLSTKWAKRWVVIKNGAIYCYRSNSDENENRAECYISLPGYKVAPAHGCKRKFAFRIAHLKRKTFFFAADRQMDMSRWMNKMGLAAIEYKYDADKSAVTRPVKDDDYYSESDEDLKVTEAKMNIGNNSKSSPKSEASVNSDEEVQTSLRTHTVAGVTSSKSNGELRNRSKSDSLKRDSGDTLSFNESGSNKLFNAEESLIILPPSPRKKPTVSPEQRRHRGKAATRSTSRLSKSLDSLIADYSTSELGYDFDKHRKAKDVAAKRAENLKQRQAFLTSPHVHIDSELSPNTSTDTSSTSVLTRGGITSYHSSPALLIDSSSNQSSAIMVSRRDVAGRPKIKPDGDDLHPDSPKKTPEKPSSSDSAGKASDDPLGNMCKTIKHSEVDIRGMNRRVTLRRKMTVLSRDPQINERMLRRRALERELKAKELELAYFDKLLSKEEISPADLHDWINQHPSLVAELGTIRRMSKRRRPPVGGAEISLQPPGDAVTASSNFFSDAALDNAVANEQSENNRNNNSSLCLPLRAGRPRSSAISETDLNLPTWLDQSAGDHLPTRRSDSLPVCVTSAGMTSPQKNGRRRKVIPSRLVVGKTTSDNPKPYLETDL